MNKEQLEARKTVIANRISQIRRELTPVASRILAFRAVGFIGGVFWAWKTKQKWFVKPLAGIGGGYAADLLSTFLLSNESGSKTAELMQLNSELDQIDSQLRKINVQENIQREMKAFNR